MSEKKVVPLKDILEETMRYARVNRDGLAELQKIVANQNQAILQLQNSTNAPQQQNTLDNPAKYAQNVYTAPTQFTGPAQQVINEEDYANNPYWRG